MIQDTSELTVNYDAYRDKHRSLPDQYDKRVWRLESPSGVVVSFEGRLIDIRKYFSRGHFNLLPS